MMSADTPSQQSRGKRKSRKTKPINRLDFKMSAGISSGARFVFNMRECRYVELLRARIWISVQKAGAMRPRKRLNKYHHR